MENHLRTPSPGRRSESRTPSPCSPTGRTTSPPRTPSPPFKTTTTKPHIRPHSSKPKKVVSGDNDVPVRRMPNLQRPWTAHAKSSSKSQKISRQAKKISRRTPARTEITVKTNPVSRKESPSPKGFSVQKYLLRTPQVDDEDKDVTNHINLDVGVKTLMSGQLIYFGFKIKFLA